MSLTIADVKRWDPDAVQEVATQLAKRGATVEQVRNGLVRLPMFASWQGQAGAAAKESIDKMAAYLLAHQDAQEAAGTAMQKSATDIWLVKRLLTAAEDEARGKYSIDETTGTVTPLTKDAGSDVSTMQDIRTKVQQVLALANTADAELAHAVNLLDGVDKPGQDPHINVPDDAQTRQAVDYAKDGWRDRDLATVRAAGADSPDGREAAARLRDYGTITNPHTGADAKKYAGERLNDWNMANNQNIGQRKDTLFGETPTQRAQSRLEGQRLAEAKFGGRVSPDEITRLMDKSEADAKVDYPRRLVRQLEGAGMSPEGAERFAHDIQEGHGIPEDLTKINQGVTGVGEGIRAHGESLPTGQHDFDNFRGAKYTAEDAEALAKFGKYLGKGSSVTEVLFGVYEWQHGVPLDEVAVNTGAGIWGGMWGGARLGAIGGEFVGPEGAVAGAIIGGVGGGLLASDTASGFYKWLKS